MATFGTKNVHSPLSWKYNCTPELNSNQVVKIKPRTWTDVRNDLFKRWTWTEIIAVPIFTFQQFSFKLQFKLYAINDLIKCTANFPKKQLPT